VAATPHRQPGRMVPRVQVMFIGLRYGLEEQIRPLLMSEYLLRVNISRSTKYWKALDVIGEIDLVYGVYNNGGLSG